MAPPMAVARPDPIGNALPEGPREPHSGPGASCTDCRPQRATPAPPFVSQVGGRQEYSGRLPAVHDTCDRLNPPRLCGGRSPRDAAWSG